MGDVSAPFCVCRGIRNTLPISVPAFILIMPHRSPEVKCGCRAAAVFCVLRRSHRPCRVNFWVCTREVFLCDLLLCEVALRYVARVWASVAGFPGEFALLQKWSPASHTHFTAQTSAQGPKRAFYDCEAVRFHIFSLLPFSAARVPYCAAQVPY